MQMVATVGKLIIQPFPRERKYKKPS